MELCVVVCVRVWKRKKSQGCVGGCSRSGGAAAPQHLVCLCLRAPRPLIGWPRHQPSHPLSNSRLHNGRLNSEFPPSQSTLPGFPFPPPRPSFLPTTASLRAGMTLAIRTTSHPWDPTIFCSPSLSSFVLTARIPSISRVNSFLRGWGCILVDQSFASVLPLQQTTSSRSSEKGTSQRSPVL